MNHPSARPRQEVADLLALDQRHLVHPFLSSSSLQRKIMCRGRGCTLWDVEGREYLDATGGLWLAQVGHGRPELARVAAQQMSTLEYSMCFWDYSNDRAIELATTLARMAPGDLDMAYFTSGGSEGNDAAIKTARYYHHMRGESERTWILSRRNGYHGLAYGGGSATGFDYMREGVGPGLPNVVHLTPPHAYRTWYFDGQSPTDFCVAELEAQIDQIGTHRIAAMIAEPVMGVGGFVVPPDDYWPRVKAVLERHGILLIFDEVVTAFGRVGSWFAAEQFGVVPDIMVTAKGISSGYIPLGAVLLRRPIADVVRRDHGFPVAYTYSGHPVACAVALENLAIIDREGLLSRAQALGAYLAQQLTPLKQAECIGEIRQIGMGLGIELVDSQITRRPLADDVAHAVPDDILDEFGVVVRVCGDHTLVLSPPLVMTEAEADRVVEAVSTVLGRLRPGH